MGELASRPQGRAALIVAAAVGHLPPRLLDLLLSRKFHKSLRLCFKHVAITSTQNNQKQIFLNGRWELDVDYFVLLLALVRG